MPLTRLVSCVSIMKLCTCFSAFVSSSLRATTATTRAVQPAPCRGQKRGELVRARLQAEDCGPRPRLARRGLPGAWGYLGSLAGRALTAVPRRILPCSQLSLRADLPLRLAPQRLVAGVGDLGLGEWKTADVHWQGCAGAKDPDTKPRLWPARPSPPPAPEKGAGKTEGRADTRVR